MARKIGTIFVEMGLDSTEYTKGEAKILQSAQTTSLKLEQNWRTLGSHSDQIFNAMKANVTNAYNAIANNSKTSADERIRAEKQMHDKIADITKQQFGAQEGLLSKLKANWIAASAAIYAAWRLVSKAWSLAEAAASFNEQMGLLDGLARQYDTSANAILKDIQKIGNGMLSMQTIAEVATSALAKGLNPEMIRGMAEAAVVLSDVMGTTADEAFRRLSSAMETGKEKSIKLAVGVIDLKEKYGDMADKMTDTQKQTALYNILMEKTREIQARTGGSTKSLSDQMESLKVTLKDMELILGQTVIRAGAGVIAIFQGLTAAAHMLTVAIATAAQGWFLFRGNMEGYREAGAIADVAMKELASQTDKSTANFRLMLATTEDLIQATSGGGKGATTGGLAGAVNQHTESEKERQKAVSDTVKALEAYSKAIQKWGEDSLKMGKDAFGAALKEQKATIDSMKDAMQSYLRVVDETYKVRINGEREVAAMIARAGGTEKDRLEAQAVILKTEKDHLKARLEGWQAYYDALAMQHAKVTDVMKQKTGELAKLEYDLAAMRTNAASIQLSQHEKLWAAQGKAADDVLLWDRKRIASEDLYRQAVNASGEERIKALNDYIKSQEQMVGKEFEYSTRRNIWTGEEISLKKEVGSEEDKILQATENINRALNLRELEQEALVRSKREEIGATVQWRTELEAAMAVAKQQTDVYIGQIEAIGKKIAEMDKKIVLTVDDQATPALLAIKATLDSIQSKTVTVSVNYATGAGGGGSDTGPYTGAPGGNPLYFGSDNADISGPSFVGLGDVFDMGRIVPFSDGGIFNTPTYFPMAGGRTGLMGENGPEAVIPLKRGSDGKLGVSGGQTINIAPGAIVVHAANMSPRQIVDEIWTPLKEKIRRETARVN